jgi:Lipase (class 3)
MSTTQSAALLDSASRIDSAYIEGEKLNLSLDKQDVLHVTLGHVPTGYAAYKDFSSTIKNIDVANMPGEAPALIVEHLHEVLVPVVCALHRGDKVVIAGHSTSGAVATLLGYVLGSVVSGLHVTVHTFGAPPVLTRHVAALYRSKEIHTTRVALHNDPVPRARVPNLQHPCDALVLGIDGVERKQSFITRLIDRFSSPDTSIGAHMLDSYSDALGRYDQRVHLP